MNTEFETSLARSRPVAPHAQSPSADFIQAISDFLDTDPKDLLMELGYYKRDEQGACAEND